MKRRLDICETVVESHIFDYAAYKTKKKSHTIAYDFRNNCI